MAFLLLHIADTYLVGLGPQYYNELVFLYHLPPFRVLEILLIGAVLFHAVNGLRVILLDFWSKAINYQKQLLWISIVLFFILFLPAAVAMLVHINWGDWSLQTVASK